MEGNLLIDGKILELQLFLRKMGWEYFREGINYFRQLEYPLVLKELTFSSGDRVLDIGAGKSFLPLYLLWQGLEVWLVDRGDFYPDFKSFYLQMWEKIFPEKAEIFKIIEGDFLQIDFPINYFDRIYAISSLEHMREQDDIKAVVKINQLLKSNGLFVCSLPFSQSGTKERELREDGFSYFQRDYELDCIFNRIIKPSGLRLKHFLVFGERIPSLARIFCSREPLSRLNSLWTILLTRLFWKIYYKGKSSQLRQFKYPGVIIVVLEK